MSRAAKTAKRVHATRQPSGTFGQSEEAKQASFHADPIPFEEFTTVVPDDALAPRTPRGTRLIFRRGGVPQPGYGVFVQDSVGRRYIRRYAEGHDGAWIAEANNPAYASLDSVRDGLTLLAVVTGRYTSKIDDLQDADEVQS